MGHFPLLTGENRRKANEILNRITSLPTTKNGREPSLYTGETGNLILYSYLNKIQSREKYQSRIYSHFAFIANEIGTARLEPFLANGVAGIGWALRHLELYDIFDLKRIGCSITQ